MPDGDDEVTALAHTLNDMLGRLEGHQQAVRRFTSDASHELKSPVANIRAMVDTAALDDPEWPALQDRLRAESSRVADLVSNMLLLSTGDEGGRQIERERVHLDDVLFGEAETLAARGVRVDIAGVTPVTIDGDRQLLARAVRNLADNAARHAATTVGFAVVERADDVTVVVFDDGPGIPEDDRDHVFERFVRLDDGRDRHAGGSGLGLAIVADIAAAHGGSIDITDRPTGGAEFHLLLPR